MCTTWLSTFGNAGARVSPAAGIFDAFFRVLNYRRAKKFAPWKLSGNWEPALGGPYCGSVIPSQLRRPARTGSIAIAPCVCDNTAPFIAGRSARIVTDS